MAKILIVDDSSTVRHQLRAALEEAKYTVVDAADGQNGLELLNRDKDISLVLCDINMPKMDGLTIVRKAKDKNDLVNIPILMLTTESSPEMKLKGKELGVVGWITKPFNGPKLVVAIEKLLSRASSAN